MILINDEGQMHLKGESKELLVQLGRAIDHVFKACEATDKGRFQCMVPVVFSLNRLNKISADPELEDHVDKMLDEIWNGVKLLEKYVDEYPVKSSRED